MPQVNTSLNSLAPGITTNNPINLIPLPGGGHKQVPNPHYTGRNPYKMDAAGQLSKIVPPQSGLSKFTQQILGVGKNAFNAAPSVLKNAAIGSGRLLAGRSDGSEMPFVAAMATSDIIDAFNPQGVIDRQKRNEAEKAIYGQLPSDYRRTELLASGQVPGGLPSDYKETEEKMFALAASTPDPEQPPVPELSLRDQLQQERDSEGLTPMQQWAKAHGKLARKVKEGQSGFKEIDAYFKAKELSTDEPGGRITPVEMLIQEMAPTPRQKDTPDINNPVPASKEKADQYLQSFLPGTPTLTTSFNQSQGNLPVSDYLSTDKLVGANYMRFGEDPEVTKAVMNLFPDLPNSQNPFSRDFNPNRFID